VKFFSIFTGNYQLLTACFGDVDEFTRLFREWTDIEWLESFFSENEADLFKPFWSPITIEQAVLKTRYEAITLRRLFRRLVGESPEIRIEKFRELFKPLQMIRKDDNYLGKKKAYGTEQRSWLRIYALKVSDDMYIITGGAIKLTGNMEEREHTRIELEKLENCRWFLREQGLIDEFGMIDFLEYSEQ